MSKIISTIFLIIFVGCTGNQENKNVIVEEKLSIESLNSKVLSNDSILTEKVKDNEISFLENTIWIHQVFKDIPVCIDSIKFERIKSGSYYSCEHDFFDSINYRLSYDTLLIDKWDYKSKVDASTGKHIVTRYFLKINKSTLKMIDIQHRNGDDFESVDSKYLTQEFKRVK